jgi:hypothetical protein
VPQAGEEVNILSGGGLLRGEGRRHRDRPGEDAALIGAVELALAAGRPITSDAPGLSAAFSWKVRVMLPAVANANVF